ncbi:Crp/Fnr family transcriptional regulator [Tropicimonas marinistellae]|uniref:Crp/Fnr family transcriptional regulator n=1 Tax=Tropicimonas marinistellae TaxID=1739787 RepID=UPI000832C879|nr:Crp/Fnr family transcriptional regulator [Tropicimonas marinistellae]
MSTLPDDFGSICETTGPVAPFLARGWLSTCPPAFRREILAAGRPVRFEDNETIYAVGDPPDGLHGLVSGTIQIEIPGDHGESILMHQAEPGFWIGDLALFSNATRLVGLTARGDVSTFFVAADRLRAIVRANPEWIEHLYALTHANMATALRLLANLAVSKSEPRIVQRLLLLDEQAGKSDGWIRVSQEDLALLTAVSLPTVQRVLRRLTDAGLVEVGYGRLRTLDRLALAEHARF